MKLQDIKRLLTCLTDKHRLTLYFLILMMLITSLAEVISIGAVVPFLGILVDPERILSIEGIGSTLQYLSDISNMNVRTLITMLFIIAGIFAGMMRLILLRLQMRLSFSIGSNFSVKIFENTLHQPYSVHVSRNSNTVINGIVTKTNAVIYNSLMPLLVLLSSTLIMTAIFSIILYIDYAVAISVFASFGLIYGVVLFLVKSKLSADSLIVSRESDRVVKIIQEGLGGIRDVILDNTQKIYTDMYKKSDVPLRFSQANIQFLSASPRFIIEALSIAVIALFALSLSSDQNGLISHIPLLGAIAIGGQRLLPVLQAAYSNWALIRGNQDSLTDVLTLLEDGSTNINDEYSNENELNFNHELVVDNVSFNYSTNSKNVLRNINVRIRKGMTVGCVGATGSGKSTLLDILMGLLEPTEGFLKIDNVIINESNKKILQSKISHVPQDVFLTDSTITENIAFGVPPNDVDFKRIREAAWKADILETIESWEDGFNTFVGERGQKLSGGQKQRIGLARALYKKSSIIVLDEATSALDNKTEKTVMDQLHKLDKNITIIIVAHRLSTLKSCDVIFEIEKGSIKRQCTYDDLIKSTV